MNVEEAVGFVIFIEVVVGVALIIWSLINAYMHRSTMEDRRLYEERIERRESEYREIESVEVNFKNGTSTTINNAKSYSYDSETFGLNDENGKVVAFFNRDDIEAVFINRKGEVK